MNTSRFVFIMLVVLTASLFPTGEEAYTGGSGLAEHSYFECNQEKIEPDLWMLLERPTAVGTAYGGQKDYGNAKGDLTYVGTKITFVGQADTSHCPDRDRLCLVEAWKTFALESQEEVWRWLDSQGVEYLSLWIDNTIYIPVADRDLVCRLSSGFDTIERIYAE